MRRVVSVYLPNWPTDRIWRKFGDPRVERICDRIMEEKPREPVPEFMKKGWLV